MISYIGLDLCPHRLCFSSFINKLAHLIENKKAMIYMMEKDQVKGKIRIKKILQYQFWHIF